MILDNIEKNIRAIQGMSTISPERKAALLLTQMHVCQRLFSDKATPLPVHEQTIACALYQQAEKDRRFLVKGVSNLQGASKG